MFNLGIPELVVILVIVLILFGGKKIPELTRSMGEAIRQFKIGMDGINNKKIKKTAIKKEDTKKS